jgi:hypothetical protein
LGTSTRTRAVPCALRSRGRPIVEAWCKAWCIGKVGRVCAVAGTLRCGLRLSTIMSVAWGSARAHSPPPTPPRVSGVMHVSPRGAIGLYGRYCGFIGTGGGHSTRAKVSLHPHPHVATRHPTHSMCAHKQSLPRNVAVWRITSRPGTVYASLGARIRRLPGHGRYEVPLNITSSIGTNEDTVDAWSQDALDKRRRRGEELL